MTEQIDVDDFLAHYGIPGMKWGRRRGPSDSSSSKSGGSSGGGSTQEPKPKMSNKKKIAIAVGIGAVLAVGTAIAVTSMNKNMDVPVGTLLKNASTAKGQAAVTAIRNATAPKNGFNPKAKETSFAAPITKSKYKPSASEIASLNKIRTETRDKMLAKSIPKPDLLDLNQYRNDTRNQMMSAPNSPSLGTLANLINGGPQVSFNSKTGKYETR